MARTLSFNTEKMWEGLNEAAQAVGKTIGPMGLNVFIDDAYTPRVVNDGVTVANNIQFKDSLKDAGAWVVRNIASQQVDDVGDGTTTATVLLQAIVNECRNRPENATKVSLSLKEAAQKALKLLSKQGIKLEKKDVERVALISAEHEALAKMITEIVDKLGDKAVINVEDSRTFKTEYEISQGYEARAGFVSPYFADKDKSGKLTEKIIMEDAPILVVRKRISNLNDIGPIFNQFAPVISPSGQVTKPEWTNKCVIVCEDIEDSIVGVLLKNHVAGVFNSIVIRASLDVLDDIAGATGATPISDQNGVTFQTVTVKHCGRAKKVVSDAHKTLFIGNGNNAKLRANELDILADNEPNMWVKKKLETRAAQLRGGIAVLKIGAPTDLEREYLKLKADDAVKAVLAALDEGIVEGGGMALWRVAQELPNKTIGEQILKKALRAPFEAIVRNTGEDFAEIVAGIGSDKMGYDAKNNKYVDMISAGIIDPIKVERVALENAISSAATFITTSSAITIEPDEQK